MRHPSRCSSWGFLGISPSQNRPAMQLTSSCQFSTAMDELRALVAATIAATAKEVAATVAATAKEINAYAKANRELIAANATAFSHPTVAVSKENNIPPSHGTCDGHDHATGGIVPVMTSSDPSGVASAAVLSSPACVMKSSPPLTVTTSFPTLVRMGGIAPADVCPEREANILKALQARPGIVPSVQIPSSTMTWMSLPTAAGLSDNVATATLRIKEVCARQDAHLEAFMADFRSIADDLDQRQSSTSASFASINDDVDDDEDEDIHIVLSIDDADVEFEDIAVVLAPPPPLPYTGAVVPFLGGECPLLSPNLLSAFELATVPPQKMACRLKRPCCRPCC
jgi:hypothetical protein